MHIWNEPLWLWMKEWNAITFILIFRGEFLFYSERDGCVCWFCLVCALICITYRFLIRGECSFRLIVTVMREMVRGTTCERKCEPVSRDTVWKGGSRRTLEGLSGKRTSSKDSRRVVNRSFVQLCCRVWSYTFWMPMTRTAPLPLPHFVKFGRWWTWKQLCAPSVIDMKSYQHPHSFPPLKPSIPFSFFLVSFLVLSPFLFFSLTFAHFLSVSFLISKCLYRCLCVQSSILYTIVHIVAWVCSFVSKHL